MKKILLASLVGASVLMSQIVVADPSVVDIGFTCPVATGAGIHTLTNFGNYIAAYGSEVIAGKPSLNMPYFMASIPANAKIPAKITAGSYVNDGTDYDSTTGVVTCKYTTSCDYASFEVKYTLTNTHGGFITAQTANSINVSAYLGLH